MAEELFSQPDIPVWNLFTSPRRWLPGAAVDGGSHSTVLWGSLWDWEALFHSY